MCREAVCGEVKRHTLHHSARIILPIAVLNTPLLRAALED
jgi:hypothetical protein